MAWHGWIRFDMNTMMLYTKHSGASGSGSPQYSHIPYETSTYEAAF